MAIFKISTSQAAMVVIAACSVASAARADSNDQAPDRQADKQIDKKPEQPEKKSDQNEKKPDSADKQADQAAKKPDGEKKPDDSAPSILLNPLYERGFIRDFVTRLGGDIEKLPAEDKPEKRAEAQAKIMKSFGDELHGKTLTLHFLVRDIDRPSDRYVIKLDPPQELSATVGRLRFVQQLTYAYSSLPADEARLIRPRDIIKVSGAAKLVYETSAASSGTQQSVPALFLGPDVYGKYYGIYLDSCQTRIEHRPH